MKVFFCLVYCRILLFTHCLLLCAKVWVLHFLCLPEILWDQQAQSLALLNPFSYLPRVDMYRSDILFIAGSSFNYNESDFLHCFLWDPNFVPETSATIKICPHIYESYANILNKKSWNWIIVFFSLILNCSLSFQSPCLHFLWRTLKTGSQKHAWPHKNLEGGCMIEKSLLVTKSLQYSS